MLKPDNIASPPKGIAPRDHSGLDMSSTRVEVPTQIRRFPTIGIKNNQIQHSINNAQRQIQIEYSDHGDHTDLKKTIELKIAEIQR